MFTPANVDVSRFPSALPFASATWQLAPVLVREQPVVRTGLTVRSKYVDDGVSFSVHARGDTTTSAASARSALRMQNARLIVVSTKLRKRMAMAMMAPRANRVKAVKADAAAEVGAVAMTEARV